MLARLRRDSDLIGVLRGAGVFFVIRAGGGLLLYVSQILLAQWVGVEEFGLFSYAWAWTYLLAILASLGLPNGSLRFIPQYRAHGDGRNLWRFTCWSWLAALAAGAIVMVAGWLVLGLGADAMAPAERAAFQIAFLAIPVLSVSVLQGQMARALGHIVLAFGPPQLARPVLFIGFGFACLALDGSPQATTFLLMTTAAFLVVTVVQGWRVFALIGAESRRHARPDTVSEAGSRHWLRTSLPMLAFSGAQIALTESGIIMVGLLLEPEEVAIFAAAARTATLLTMVTTAIDTMTVPKIAALHAGSQRTAIDLMLRRTILAAFLLALAMFLFIAGGGEFILGLFGDGFTRGYGTLLILAGGIVVSAALAPVPAILNVTGSQDVVTVLSLTALALNVLLNVLLIGQFGLLGAALAQAITVVMLRAALLGVLRRRLGVLGILAPPGMGLAPDDGRATMP